MLRRLFFVMFVIMATLVITGSSYAFVDNIVAAWTFDEGSGTVIHDVSGNGNDGEVMGAANWDDGRFGSALVFDGANHVEVPFDESMRVLNQGDFTLAAWFLVDIVPQKMLIVQQGDTDGTGRSWLFTHEGASEIRSFLGGDTTASGVNVEEGQWYHTAVVVTEGGGTDTVQLYVNGVIAGAPFQGGMEDCAGVFYIGCHKDLINYMDGIIDEIVLLNKALDEDEINSLMNNGINDILAVEPTDKLAVCWGDVKDIH